MVTWGFKILRSECGVDEFWVFKEERLNLFLRIEIGFVLDLIEKRLCFFF